MYHVPRMLEAQVWIPRIWRLSPCVALPCISWCGEERVGEDSPGNCGKPLNYLWFGLKLYQQLGWGFFGCCLVWGLVRLFI